MELIIALLIAGALICFFLAVLGVPATIDLVAAGLLLWVIASCFGATGLVLVLLALAAIAFALAVFKFKPPFNWVALGLLFWMVALLLGAVLKIAHI